MRNQITFYLAALFISLGVAFQASAQQNPAFFSFPQNHLDWYTVESEHFLIHFQEGNDRPAQVISVIAEEVWDEITTFYEFTPDIQISIILIDRLDYANGAAFFFDNKIEIWLPALHTSLRGTNDWLRNVITHEFAHIVQIQASMSGSRRWPVSYLQWLSYEDVRRPDVLYGYPSGVISYPFSIASVPAWFAEGTAQYMTGSLHYDYWDTHNDMFLRTRILDNKELGLVEMGHFASKTSMEREQAYNQGFSFTTYLANRFGEDSIREITVGLKRTSDIRRSIRRVTGIDGEQVYQDWVDSLRTNYRDFTENIRPFEAQPVNELGFFNFNPVFTPDGKIAYLSNSFFDGARLQLFLQDEPSSNKTSLINLRDSHAPITGGFQHSCGMYAEPVINRIESGFSFSPDGNLIAYNRTRLNRFGETYNDLYVFNRETEDTERLSFSARLTEPAWSPDGDKLAALQQTDGTLNLVLVNPENGDISPLTSFTQGEQLLKPVWSPDGNFIYAAKAERKGRKIVRIDVNATHSIDTVLRFDDTDIRDPFLTNDGAWMYFSADFGGKFDVYRLNLETEEIEKLTDVIGGAFMPFVSDDGVLLYSEFTSDGYKIRKAPIHELKQHQLDNQRLAVTEVIPSPRPNESLNPLNQFDDASILSFDPSRYAIADTSIYEFTLTTRGQSDFRQFYSYQDTFLDFSFYPVIRFDNYSKEFGSNRELMKAGRIGDIGRNIGRDMKVGFYMSSREVLERFNIFGGLLVAPASLDAGNLSEFMRPARLIDLDRDLFFIAEYTGLPFIERHWSPTIQVALYNLRRNVSNGLEIEDFSCTACLPDTLSVNIAYDIWQAEVNLISKLNNFSLLELGYQYTPYRVSTSSFFSREFDQFVPGSTQRYFIGSALSATYNVDFQMPYRHGDIAPVGVRGHVRYSYSPGRLLDSFEIRDGTLIPIYENFQNHSLELDSRIGFPLFGPNVFQLRTRFFTYFNNPDEFFFLDYIGGFDGMRSYPFFSLGGETTAFGTLSYYQPILTNINRQSGRLILDKIFARFFFEAGNGWGGPLGIGDDIKTGIGAELRINLLTSYLFPTRFFVSGAYGLNRFDLNIPEGFVSAAGRESVSFGREVLINFGVLFDFEF